MATLVEPISIERNAKASLDLYAKEPAAKTIAGQNCGSLRMNVTIENDKDATGINEAVEGLVQTCRQLGFGAKNKRAERRSYFAIGIPVIGHCCQMDFESWLYTSRRGRIRVRQLLTICKG